MTSGELAEAVGVSRDTLRYYERKGVLSKPGRTYKGYRLYAADALERVRLVRRALAVGFTLDELARLFRERESGMPPCRQAFSLAQAKLMETERQLESLLALREELRQMISDWSRSLEKSETGECARLLDLLPETSNRKKTSKSTLKSKNI